MHHKRKRPKNSRAGCLLCKPWKANGIKGTADARPMQERRSDLEWMPRPPNATGLLRHRTNLREGIQEAWRAGSRRPGMDSPVPP